MSDIFINTEIQKPPKPYNNNKCPPGHYISIQAGGMDIMQEIGVVVMELIQRQPQISLFHC